MSTNETPLFSNSSNLMFSYNTKVLKIKQSRDYNTIQTSLFELKSINLAEITNSDDTCIKFKKEWFAYL